MSVVSVRFVFDSSEDMRQLERWGMFEGILRSVGQMDALLASAMQTGGTRDSNVR